VLPSAGTTRLPRRRRRNQQRQAGASNHLQALEDRLGTRLLNRTTRRQSLTEFGKVPKGRLRVTAPVAFGTELLMPALAEYGRLFPKVDLDVVITDAVVDLAEDGFEAAIRLGNLPDADLVARPLAPYRLRICGAPTYLAARGEPMKPEDLGRHDCLAYSYSPRSEWRSAQAVWRMTGPDGEIVPFGTRLQTDSAEGLRRAHWRAWAEIMVSEDIASGRLVRLLLGYAPPIRPMTLLYLRDRRMSPKLRSFVDFVVDRFSTQS
jgi:DNA-binding transcriptional LysR family regulator